jgi:hypothetical protein
MDGSRVIAWLVQAEVVKLAPMSSSWEGLPLPFADQFIHESQGERLDGRTDEQMGFRGVEPFLEKQSEGEQRLSPDAFEPDPAPFCGKQWIGQEHGTLRGQEVNSETSVDILAFDDIE